MPKNYQHLIAFPLLTFTENESNATCTFPNMEKISIKMAAIQPADCIIENTPLENTVTSTPAVNLRSSVLTALTPNNITGNNGTRAGSTQIFHFTTYELFVLLFNDFIVFCIPSYTSIKARATEQAYFYVLVNSYRHCSE